MFDVAIIFVVLMLLGSRLEDCCHCFVLWNWRYDVGTIVAFFVCCIGLALMMDANNVLPIILNSVSQVNMFLF